MKVFDVTGKLIIISRGSVLDCKQVLIHNDKLVSNNIYLLEFTSENGQLIKREKIIAN